MYNMQGKQALFTLPDVQCSFGGGGIRAVLWLIKHQRVHAVFKTTSNAKEATLRHSTAL